MIEFPESIIVHVGYTSRASISFQNAVIAAENFENIHLIDALNVTGGLGAIALYAADVIEKELEITLALLIEKIETVIPKSRLAFVPGSLNFLKVGGRVSNVAYLGARSLKVNLFS